MNPPSTPHAVPRFRLGRILATPAALNALEHASISAIYLLIRHACGDWGDLCDADRQENELALYTGARLLSSYMIRDNLQVWVITEADRSATTLLLPGDY
ncbi:hypothetical protein [Paraburkholderia caribensis]|uniref:hypothetical protein n=1 Tax=Paraburkholderia caribensis TaxID=75105 RepID=UPI000720D3F6|nr:hypothetical protein [Paraburkholderia caribensis]ALP61357.1 hypothetical protein AN416_01290 [Paraburkholderia caribensis]AUT50517.1 hypothetical protein C2L66_00735 [Paraburkholderia caribensis]